MNDNDFRLTLQVSKRADKIGLQSVIGCWAATLANWLDNSLNGESLKQALELRKELKAQGLSSHATALYIIDNMLSLVDDDRDIP